jgi:hypothetical protein
MEEIHRRIEALADQVHRLDIAQNVMSTNMLSLTANVASLTASVTSLSVIINRGQGAISVVKWLWGAIGLLAGSALTLWVKLHS